MTGSTTEENVFCEDISDEGSEIVENGTVDDDRIFTLESKISAHETEIILLKSALSDALSRLNTVEAELKQGSLKSKKDASVHKTSSKTTAPKKPRPKSMVDAPEVERNGQHNRPPSVAHPNLTSKKSGPISPTKKKSSVSEDRGALKKSKKGSFSSQENGRDSFDSKDDEKPKIILAKKGTVPKKIKSVSSVDETSPRSPRDDTVKFNIRGRVVHLYPPTDFQEESINPSAPDKKLQLKWVYGYRGKDCRDNVFYLASGDVVYNIAGVIVLYNVKTDTQRHFTKHTDDVKCIALHPNKTTFGSGQVAGHGEDKKPHVLVWDSTSLEVLKSFGQGVFERGLCAVKFSTFESGKYMIAIDESNDHVIYVYEWEKGQLITETKASKEIVLGAKWNPVSQLSFATYGKSHLIFWTWSMDPMSLTKKAAIYEKFGKPKYVQSVVYTKDGDLVSGDSNGNILLFKDEGSRNRVTGSVLSAHKGGVFCLCYLEEKDTILSSGKDGQVSLWSSSLEKLSDLAKITEQYGPGRCLLYDSVDDMYFIGTSKNCIIQYGSEMTNENALVVGHCEEMWGLATHPTDPTFATCAQEQLVCVWNCDNKKNVWTYYIEDHAECAEFHPTLDYLLIGNKSGGIHFLNYASLEEEITLPVSRDCISDIKISPDGKAFAAACRDTKIYLFTWCDDITAIRKPIIMPGHSSRVLHLDWSADSEYLQSNSSSYEVLYWAREAGVQVLSPAALRDVPWSTWTCPFGYPAIGIWPEGADGTDINACSRSHDEKLIATGDDFGEVKIFRYPSVKARSQCNVGTGHSSHVTCVRFLANDAGLVTVGGQDCSVMQWNIV